MTPKLSTFTFIRYLLVCWLALAPRLSFSECPQPETTPTAAQKTAILDELKDAIDHEGLISPEFYDEGAIKNLFCAVDAESYGYGEARRYGVHGLGALYDYPRMYPGVTISVYFETQPKRHGQLILPFLDDQLDVGGVLRVFGSNYEIVNPYYTDSPLHPTPLSSPTSPFGNKELVYQFEGRHSKTSVRADLQANGAIKYLIVSQREKQ